MEVPPWKTALVVLVLFLAGQVGALERQCNQPEGVFSFGYGFYGQLGDGSSKWKNTPIAVDTSGVLNGHFITAIDVGEYHSLVLSETGQVFSFGNNGYGQLGDGTYENAVTPVAVYAFGDLAGHTITAIAAGASHSLVLSATGQVFSFGYNHYGQLGDGTDFQSIIPVSVDRSGVLSGHTITAIAAGAYHSLVLSATGQVFSFGYNGYGQLGDEANIQRYAPVAVSTSGVLNGHIITAVAAGYYHSLVLSASGEVFSFGANYNGQLGDGTDIARNVPVAVNTSGVLNGKTITTIAAGADHSLVLSATGTVFSFGYNGYGQLGDGTFSSSNFPVAVNASEFGITAIAAGAYHSLVLDALGRVFSFGNNDNGQLGDDTHTTRNTPVAVVTQQPLSIMNISGGYSHSVILSATGQVFSFGINDNGQLGDPQPLRTNVPTTVDTSGVLNGLSITAVSAKAQHSLVLSATGRVFSFGLNDAGQLGDGTNIDRNLPVAVDTSGVLDGHNITTIAAGIHSLVLSATGQVFSFGSNGYGQLGDGTWESRNTPVAVDTSGVLNGKTITDIAAGVQHSLVLSATGQVFSFGQNAFGQLGDGTLTSTNIPVAVNTSGVLNGLNITAIAAGAEHSLVLSATGRVFSFGQNGNGQLGDGTWTSRIIPVAVNAWEVLDGHNITAIAAGLLHSLVLSATGRVFSFGRNSNGQLGDGTFMDSNFPVAVNTSGVLNGHKIIAIAAGIHSLVLSATGDVFSFGYNGNGQLGDGTWTSSNLPVAVNRSGVLNGYAITAIAAGAEHSLVLSFSFRNLTFGQVRDGSNTDKQLLFQSETGKVAFNWDGFVGTLSNGQSVNVTTYGALPFKS